MEIMMTVKSPTPEFLRDYLALMERHAAALVPGPPPKWTPHLARAYYNRLPPRAGQILRIVVEGEGSASADDIRHHAGQNLRGTTGGFARIYNEGVRAGLWPAGLPVPVQSVKQGGKLIRLDMPFESEPHAEPVLDAFAFLLPGDQQGGQADA